MQKRSHLVYDMIFLISEIQNYFTPNFKSSVDHFEFDRVYFWSVSLRFIDIVLSALAI